jgi:hypothetical protein
MWMRSCAVCEALLRKLQLWGSIRCQWGREWQASAGDEPLLHQSATDKKEPAVHRPVPKVIKFYVPSVFRKHRKWTPSEQRGKLIEFRLPAKKSA